MSKSQVIISTEKDKIVTFDCVSNYVDEAIKELTGDINNTIANINKIDALFLATLTLTSVISDNPYKELLSNILTSIISTEANALTFTVDGNIHSTVDVSLLRCEEYKQFHTHADQMITDRSKVDFPVISNTKS